MTITISLIAIPIILSIIILIMMFRPLPYNSGYFDFGGLFRLFWLIPLSVMWGIYAVIVSWGK